MTVDHIIQVAGELITVLAVVLTYLGTRSKVRRVSTMVDGNNKTLTERVEQLGQSIQGQGGRIPPSPPPSTPPVV